MKPILAVALLAAGQFYPQEKQDRIKTYWPDSVPFPAALAFYEPTRYAQSTAVMDYPQTRQYNVLTHEWVPAVDEAKYSVPGGLLGARSGGGYVVLLLIARRMQVIVQLPDFGLKLFEPLRQLCRATGCCRRRRHRCHHRRRRQ